MTENDDDRPSLWTDPMPGLLPAAMLAMFWVVLGIVVQATIEPRAEFSSWGFYEKAGMVLGAVTLGGYGLSRALGKLTR